MSRVERNSAAAQTRERVLIWQSAHKPPSRRAGNYWRVDDLRAALDEYRSMVQEACEQDGVVEAATRIGLLAPVSDVLGTWFRARDSTLEGETRAHRAVRAWATDRTGLDDLRALCIAGLDIDAVNNNQETAMDLAAKLNAVEPARSLLEFGAGVPLLVAAEADAVDAFRLLCAYGMETKNLAKLAAKRTDGGYTCLHLAAINGGATLLEEALKHKEFKRLINAHSTRVDAKTVHPARVASTHNLYQTALAKCCRYGHAAAAAVLLRFGAKPDVADAAKRTPCHIACEYGFYDCLNVLIEHGANPGLKDARGRDARDHCTLGMSNKTVRRQPLDDVLSTLHRIVYKNGAGTTTTKRRQARVDYKKCLRLLDAMDSFGVGRGSATVGWLFTRYFSPPDDDDKNTSYLSSLFYLCAEAKPSH